MMRRPFVGRSMRRSAVGGSGGSNARACAAMLLIVCVACTPGAPEAFASPSSETGDSAIASAAAELPDALSFNTQADAAASGTITFEEGGTVAATAADGTAFELTVPPRAVARDTEITMTPVSNVEGITEEPGPVYAVQLEPEGLRFYEWVRLEITPAAEIPIEEQLMFEAAGDGSDAGLAMLDPTTDEVVVLLDHFSLAGVAGASAMQRAIFLRKSAENAQRRISNQMAELLMVARQQQILGSFDEANPLGTEEYQRLADEFQREVVDKFREAAALSCGAFKDDYIRVVLMMERARQLLGTATDAALAELFRPSAFEQQRYEECEEEAIRQCKEASDPSILTEVWIALAYIQPPPEPIAEEARERCVSAYEFSGAELVYFAFAEGEGVRIEWTVTEHWRGAVCGDPLEAEWQVSVESTTVWSDGEVESYEETETAPLGPSAFAEIGELGGEVTFLPGSMEVTVKPAVGDGFGIYEIRQGSDTVPLEPVKECPIEE